MDRQDLIDELVDALPISPAELAAEVKKGGALYRMLGLLHRHHQEATNQAFSLADLISDEGRLKAIQAQGVVQGRQTLLEFIQDLILEGMENESGTGSAEPGGE